MTDRHDGGITAASAKEIMAAMAAEIDRLTAEVARLRESATRRLYQRRRTGRWRGWLDTVVLLRLWHFIVGCRRTAQERLLADRTELYREAADEIDRLTAEAARLREALEAIVEHVRDGGQIAGVYVLARAALHSQHQDREDDH